VKFNGIELIDLGNGVWFSRTVNSAGDHVGVIEWHYCQDKENLAGGILLFDIPENASEDRPKWTLVTDDPLTMHPSVLCRTCGLHGWITNGQWVTA
jgi:hypothetical protein